MTAVTQVELTPTERNMVNRFQRGFPICERPYAEIAAQLGMCETSVMTALDSLIRRGVISRIGSVLKPGAIGSSTLAALTAPPDELERIAGIINAYPEVNHNYVREHTLNVWFVVVAPSIGQRDDVVREIETKTNCKVYTFPLEKPYHIDLGFSI